jgi:hypothetical protein
MSAATICRHGQQGFCWDDATPEQRAAFDFLHAHAYAYAAPGDRDAAEAYAADFAEANYLDPDEAPAHSGLFGQFERWRATRG